MALNIDGALYPDCEPPEVLETTGEEIDFLARLCSAWDFGRLPDVDVVAEIRKPAWKDSVDRCRLLTSPVYHLLRKWHGLPVLPFLGSLPEVVTKDPSLDWV
jgi:hypothetical protein